jgi:hypothetical protein
MYNLCDKIEDEMRSKSIGRNGKEPIKRNILKTPQASRNKFKIVDSVFIVISLYLYIRKVGRNYDALNNEKEGLVSDIYDIITLSKPHVYFLKLYIYARTFEAWRLNSNGFFSNIIL